MITTSKNNSFICVDDTCDSPAFRRPEDHAQVKQPVHPLKNFLHDLWLDFLLFLGTDRWDGKVSLKMGDSHYMMRMEDIQNRWRPSHE